jgi:hypothetical protein
MWVVGGDEASEWLSREDEACRDDRLARLRWIASLAPPSEYWYFNGGLTAKSLFEEARYSFVYGQFLATVLTGLAFLERELSAQFFASGRNDLTNASITRLIDEALKYGWITAAQHRQLTRARRVRNTVAHYQEAQARLNQHGPKERHGEEDFRELHRRVLAEGKTPYEAWEEDARSMLQLVFTYLSFA